MQLLLRAGVFYTCSVVVHGMAAVLPLEGRHSTGAPAHWQLVTCIWARGAVDRSTGKGSIWQVW
jgi:hypothetical protein